MKKIVTAILGFLVAGGVWAQSSSVVGSTTNLNDTVQVQAFGTVGIGITGVFTQTLNFEGTTDTTNWFAIQATNSSTGTAATTTTTTGMYQVAGNGLRAIRVRANPVTSGTANIVMYSLLGALSYSGTGGVAGVVPTSQGGLGANFGAATGIPQFNAGVVSVSTLPYTSSLFTGVGLLANGFTGSNMSGTGGSNFIVKQLGVGTTLSSAQLVAGDLYPTTVFGSSATGLLDPSAFVAIDDFIHDPNACAAPCSISEETKVAVVNTGIYSYVNNTAGHPGIVQIATGTTSATGGARLNGQGAYVNPTTGTNVVDWYINIPALSNGTDTYLLGAGFTDTASTFWDPTVAQIACGILYKQATDTHWQAMYSHTSVALTTAVSTVTVTTGWHHLTTVLNTSGSCQLFVDGAELTSAGSPISNTLTPQGSAFLLPMTAILSSLSVNSKVLNVDRWLYLDLGLSR
jgi:hypothetical protein